MQATTKKKKGVQKNQYVQNQKKGVQKNQFVQNQATRAATRDWTVRSAPSMEGNFIARWADVYADADADADAEKMSIRAYDQMS